MAERVADIGFIAAGHHHLPSQTGVAKPAAAATPPQLHGPYYQWTAKVDGQDLTRRLSENQATLYQEWISNDRQLRALLAQMRGVSAKATELIMKDTSTKARG